MKGKKMEGGRTLGEYHYASWLIEYIDMEMQKL